MRCSPWLLSLFLVSVASAQVIEQKTPVVSGSGGTPGGTSGQLQYNAAGSFGGFTMAGDCTLAQPNIVCTTSNGVTIVTTTGTQTLTNKSIAATEINSGTLPTAQTAALTGDATKAAGSTATTVVKINGVALSGLATGILKNTTTTGVPSIAAAGTDYIAPGGALGTPSSGTATNLTGLPVGGIAAIGANTIVGNATGGSASPTAISLASLVMADLQAQTTFTVTGTGCTPSAHTGGPFGGEVTLASGPCTAIVITFNGATGFTANGWHCDVGDKTLQAAGTWWGSWIQSAYTATTATLPIPGASGATDVISFFCHYF